MRSGPVSFPLILDINALRLAALIMSVIGDSPSESAVVDKGLDYGLHYGRANGIANQLDLFPS